MPATALETLQTLATSGHQAARPSLGNSLAGGRRPAAGLSPLIAAAQKRGQRMHISVPVVCLVVLCQASQAFTRLSAALHASAKATSEHPLTAAPGYDTACVIRALWCFSSAQHLANHAPVHWCLEQVWQAYPASSSWVAPTWPPSKRHCQVLLTVLKLNPQKKRSCLVV